MLASIVELSPANIGKIVQQTDIGGCLAHDTAKLAGRDPRVAILDMGKNVCDWATIDRQRQSLAGFQIRDNS